MVKTPETDGEDRKAYMFPGKSSYRCPAVAMAKTIVLNWYLKDNKNRPFANIMVQALKSPSVYGGVLTFVMKCKRAHQKHPRRQCAPADRNGESHSQRAGRPWASAAGRWRAASLRPTCRTV